MSKSINQLFKMVQMSEEDSKENTLFNPDVPTQALPDMEQNVGNGLDDQLEIYDEAHKDLSSRNVINGQSLLRRQFLDYPTKMRQTYYDNTISPNIIRARTHPDDARANMSSQTQQSLMPSSVNKPHNQMALIRGAMVQPQTTERKDLMNVQYKQNLDPTV